jgi:hypothetical protein
MRDSARDAVVVADPVGLRRLGGAPAAWPHGQGSGSSGSNR